MSDGYDSDGGCADGRERERPDAMPDWQERITRETEPAVRVEHDLRYGIAAPLLAGSATWCDLGCGNGLAAATAFAQAGPGFAGRVVLVDVDADAVADAAGELEAAGRGVERDDTELVALTADLSEPGELARVREALLARDGARAVTCFEVVEHLSSFVALLEWLIELANEADTTVVLSVPNDAFWAIENPHHHTTWSEGAFEELRRLLPAEHVLLTQSALQGSVAAPLAQDTTTRHTADVETDDAVPTHFLVAFGPRCGELRGAAAVAQTDQLAQRRWERQRESDLAVLQATLERLREVERTNVELTGLARQHFTWFEEWRTYIHELEGQLGIPSSSATPDDRPPGAAANDDGTAPVDETRSAHAGAGANANSGLAGAANGPANEQRASGARRRDGNPPAAAIDGRAGDDREDHGAPADPPEPAA